VATALGVATGQATWTIATSAGLAVVLMASAPLFLAVRLAGAAYLIYLGGRSLLAAARDREAAGGRSLPPAARTAFVQGFLSNLSNGKMIAFFISLLLTLAWLTGYAFAVERMGRWFRRSGVRRAIDGLLGAVLVGLGLRVSAEALASTSIVRALD